MGATAILKAMKARGSRSFVRQSQPDIFCGRAPCKLAQNVI
jgi:hypothetical protein